MTCPRIQRLVGAVVVAKVDHVIVAQHRPAFDRSIGLVLPSSRARLNRSPVCIWSRFGSSKHRHPFLSSGTLAEGMLDLKTNTPSRDIVLLAPAANLVVRSGLHAALVPLILDAAGEVHGDSGFLEEQGTFPNVRFVDGTLNAEARRHFKSGPPLFYRILPFRVAVWLDRMKFAALPLFTLLLPLFKVAPPLYRWRIRSSIYRWYRVLREVDLKLRESERHTDFSADITRLQDLDDELSEISVPLAYMEEFYNLRLHVAYLLDKVLTRQRQRQITPRRRAA